ncbi:MAG: SdiA-regulated domain-containing protein [Vulcanimicrobiota bacterium]
MRRSLVAIIWLLTTLTSAQEWKPGRLFQLPPELKEISGITPLDENRILCIQDEAGEIFTVDINREMVQERLPFAEPGDYEEITKTGENNYWILRSDALLIELKREAQGYERTAEYPVAIDPHEDFESLAYDPENNRLLLAPKDRDKSSDDDRNIYEFSLKSKTLNPQPVLTLSVRQTLHKVESLGIVIPERRTKKGKLKDSFRLRPSALALRPGSDEIVILSAWEPCLMTVDRAGNLLNFKLLDSQALPQPEGLLFLNKDTLLIASEGKDSDFGILQEFHWSEAISPANESTEFVPDEPQHSYEKFVVPALIFAGFVTVVLLVRSNIP